MITARARGGPRYDEQLGRLRVASLIDHTLLKPEAGSADIRRLCAEAREWGFAAVCVNPCWVRLAVEEVAGSGVTVAAVVGFPLGANETAVKVAEAERAMEAGARELDFVLNIGWLREGAEAAVGAEIGAVARAAHAAGGKVKVILETALLSDAQKRAACRLAEGEGADFVKTSTGFGPGGATVEDVRLLRAAVGPQVGVKAAGGIRSWEDCRAMLAAGANRIGTSAGVAIVQAAAAQA
jgi:deoxyribose-phosphate aldolase